MSTARATAPDLSGRAAPGLGGFNLTALKLEVRRLLRNRRTVLITLIFPVFFLIFPSVLLVTLGPACIMMVQQLKTLVQ